MTADRSTLEYLERMREDFPGDPWRYVPTVVSQGLSFYDLTDAELEWYVGEQERIVMHIASWPGEAYTKHMPTRLAEERARLEEARAALAARQAAGNSTATEPEESTGGARQPNTTRRLR